MGRGKQLNNRQRAMRQKRKFLHLVEKEATRIAKDDDDVHRLYRRIKRIEHTLESLRFQYGEMVAAKKLKALPVCFKVMEKMPKNDVGGIAVVTEPNRKGMSEHATQGG